MDGRCVHERLTTFVACARENEVKQALQLLRGAIKKHPDVFELGEGTSAVRVFANVFALSAVSDVRCAVSTGTTVSERLTRLCFFSRFSQRGISRTGTRGVVRTRLRGVQDGRWRDARVV